MLAAGRLSEVKPGKQCLPSEERPVYWVLNYEYWEFFSHLFIHFFFKFVSSVGLELVKSSYVNVLRLLETSSRTASQRSFLRWSQYLTLAQRSRSHGIFSFYLYLSYLQLGDCLCVPVGLYIVHECSSWSQPIFLETIFWWFPPCPVMRLIGRIEDPLCFSAPPQSSP